MGTRLTFGLVLLAAVTLIAGVTTHSAWVIYLSIACSIIAAIGLLVGSRQRRKKGRGEGDDTLAWTASLAEPTIKAMPAPARSRTVRVRTDPRTDAVGATDRFDLDSRSDLDQVSPSRPVRRRSIGTVRPVPVRAPVPVEPEPEPSYDDDEAFAAAAMPPTRSQPPPTARRPAGAAPRSPAAAPRSPAAAPRSPAAAPRSPAPVARPAPPPAKPVRRPVPVEEYPFPIEDYDYLSIADIVPLLPELDDDELVEVLLREQQGANRVAILNRIDALLEGEDW